MQHLPLKTAGTAVRQKKTYMGNLNARRHPMVIYAPTTVLLKALLRMATANTAGASYAAAVADHRAACGCTSINLVHRVVAMIVARPVAAPTAAAAALERTASATPGIFDRRYVRRHSSRLRIRYWSKCRRKPALCFAWP